MSYIQFNKITEKLVEFWSIKDNIELGRLEKMRVGAWESWCLFLNEDCYLSASCNDEVREYVRKSNGGNK